MSAPALCASLGRQQIASSPWAAQTDQRARPLAQGRRCAPRAGGGAVGASVGLAQRSCTPCEPDRGSLSFMGLCQVLLRWLECALPHPRCETCQPAGGAAETWYLSLPFRRRPWTAAPRSSTCSSCRGGSWRRTAAGGCTLSERLCAAGGGGGAAAGRHSAAVCLLAPAHHLCPPSCRRTWVVKNFVKGLALCGKIAEVAESEGHHPDLHLTGKRACGGWR